MGKPFRFQTKAYRGAYTLITNQDKTFRYIIFYKKNFYTYEFEFSKRGEYTNEEYLRCMDATYLAAKGTIDKIKGRNLFSKIYAKLTRATSVEEEGELDTNAGEPETSASAKSIA